MNVLYCYKGGSDAGLSLRFSLRSMDKHMANVGAIALVGEGFPDWLTADVIRIDCTMPYERKQKNLLHEVLYGLAKLEWGPCLYSSDDHICLADCDADAFPWFSNGKFPTYAMYAEKGLPIGPYRGSIAATHDLLEGAGYPCDVKMSGHVNTHLDGNDLDEVRRLAGDYWKTTWGYEFSELFAAVARRRDASISPEYRYDVKIPCPCSTEFLEREIGKGRGFMSMSDSALLEGGAVLPCLMNTFPGKSRWER